MTPERNLNLAYLCGSVTHQNWTNIRNMPPPLPPFGSKSGVQKQPAVEKLLHFQTHQHPEIYAAKHSTSQLPRVQNESLS